VKSAIYVEQGVTQVVLTPENEWEKNALRMVYDAMQNGTASAYEGEFYECRGGWNRWAPYGGTSDDRSLIVRVVRSIADNSGVGRQATGEDHGDGGHPC
jgi:hypothetical protein